MALKTTSFLRFQSGTSSLASRCCSSSSLRRSSSSRTRRLSSLLLFSSSSSCSASAWRCLSCSSSWLSFCWRLCRIFSRRCSVSRMASASSGSVDLLLRERTPRVAQESGFFGHCLGLEVAILLRGEYFNTPHHSPGEAFGPDVLVRHRLLTGCVPVGVGLLVKGHFGCAGHFNLSSLPHLSTDVQQNPS